MSDIRKWFMKQHDVGNGKTSPAAAQESPQTKISPTSSERTERRKTSKYFSHQKCDPKDETETLSVPAKRKTDSELKPPPKKLLKGDEQNENTATPRKKTDVDADDDYHHQSSAKRTSHRPQQAKNFPIQSSDDDYHESPVKPAGRGRGKKGQGEDTPAVSGRGRGAAGRAVGFMNFGERKDPPHKGEKEVPEGNPECLTGLTFVISGTLDSLEREEAEDLIKRHGGRVTTAVSKKTNFLLCDEDVGGKKSARAKELGTSFLTEDRLFEMILSSEPLKTPEAANEAATAPPKPETKSVPHRVKPDPDPVPRKSRVVDSSTTKNESKSGLPWTEKYRPKTHADLVGNQSIVKQLHDWLSHWNETFLQPRSKTKGKKPNPAGSAGSAKKAVMLSGAPGIGKTSSAKLVCRMLGFQAVEVNASDSRGKADAKIEKGVGGKSTNSIKELINNESLSLSHAAKRGVKSVLIMDEVDGMSAGDRGGVVDLIASIKISKIPIICICNDRYSQKLKSLVNYCLLLNFRKPTKQQMSKRLIQIAGSERVHVNQIALEELSERVNGDMRMALNQLEYMHISMSTIVYDDVRHRLMNSAKDEDISPFAAVDKLFGFDSGKLRMDERIDLGMSDPDLVPLLVQENYLNYRPVGSGGDESGVKRMEMMSRAAESIGDGDIMNVQIRRYRQWQLSQSASVASSVIPAAVMRGSREVFEPGERNFNRFAGWLGKNSTAGKNARLLADIHAHAMSSRVAATRGRDSLRLDVLTVLVRRLTDPLRTLPKDDALCEVIGLMDAYSMCQDDFDAAVEMSRFQRRPDPLDGVLPAVKSSLTRAYNQGMKTRALRAADLVPLPGSVKKGVRKSTGGEEMTVEGNDDVDADADDDADDDDDEVVGKEKKLEILKSKGIVVELEAHTAKGSDKKRKGGASTEKRSAPASATKKKR